MKIFISHASKDREIVLKFVELLKTTNQEIEIFCSSEEGSIRAGENFVEIIFEKLNDSDLFIPILSTEYFKSRFCMIELGAAYGCLYNKHRGNGKNYIFPFTLYPMNKGNALSGTPMSNIQSGEMENRNDIRKLLEYLTKKINAVLKPEIEKQLCEFNRYTIQKMYRDEDVVGKAKIQAYCDSETKFYREEDIVNYVLNEDGVNINFNMNPYQLNDFLYPKYIGLALKYIDKLNMGKYLDCNEEATFKFMLMNHSGALKEIFIEFKYSEANRILETFSFRLNSGKNILNIPIKKMRSKALSEIQEICFVIHPADVNYEKGSFQLKAIKMDV